MTLISVMTADVCYISAVAKLLVKFSLPSIRGATKSSSTNRHLLTYFLTLQVLKCYIFVP